MTLHKKSGMWISDWNVSDGSDDEGCWNRQKEQDRKARAMVAQLKTQGWKRIPDKKVNSTIVDNISSSELLTAMKKYNADVKKKWANKKVSTSIPGRPKQTYPAWKYHSFFPHGDLKSELQEFFSDDYKSFGSYWIGELGGYGALMNKGNQYRLIMTGGSDDDEAAHWSTPVFQLALKGQSKLAKTVKKTTTRKSKAANKPKAKKTTTRKSKPKAKAKTGRKAPTISATKRKIGTRMRGNDGKMWEVKKSGKSQRWMAGAESFGAETFEAPRRKRLDFAWIGEDSSDKEWARSGSNTIAAAIKKAKAEGWKVVSSQYWGDNAATRKSRMRREAKVWDLMSKSPQWKPWLKFLTERNADNEMSETMDIFRGKAYWKAKNRNSVSILGTTQDYGPWIYDEDRIYVPDHFSEDGGWQVLVKGNQALLLYYIADYDGPVSTPLMRKTFNLSPVNATKTAKKTTTRKSKPKTKYILGKKDRSTDLKKRKSPPYSAKQFPKGARKKGNNGKMWTIVTDRRGVKRWKA